VSGVSKGRTSFLTKKRSQAGFTLIEIVACAAILFISVIGLFSSQKTVLFFNGKNQKQQDISNILAQRLSYFRSVIKNQIGPTNFLRLYATSSGSLGNFNPILDIDINQNFSQALSNGTYTISNPENIELNGHTYALTYNISLQMISYNESSGTFQSTTLSFPNSAILLSQIGIIAVSATAQNVTDPNTRNIGEVDVSLP
jgi:type II secretory pathway pseudopilin PulG